MKQRIGTLDLQLLAKELHDELVGFRLRNIYNIADSNRQFLLKFGKPDSKLNVVIDCGLRVHITDFNRPIPPSPSWFVSKLRQYLKEKRLTNISQVPNDRILVFTFADGMYYLVLEFFSAGNVLLLNSDKKILLLQRVVEDYEMKVGEAYNIPNFDLESKKNIIEREPITEERLYSWLNDAEAKARKFAVQDDKNVKKKKAVIPSIQKLLFINAPYLSSDLIQNGLKSNGLNPSESCLTIKDRVLELVDIMRCLETQATALLNGAGKPITGYIVAKRNELFDAERDSEEMEFLYSNFHPFKPYIEKCSGLKLIAIDGPYNKTVDTFFSTIESLKYATRMQTQSFQAKKKLEDAKATNASLLNSLRDAQNLNEEKGRVLIANVDLVEEARSAVQNLLDQQMDWKSMEKLIKSEQLKHNKVACSVHLPMDLNNNKITLLLPRSIDENLNCENSSRISNESDYSNLSDESDESDISDFEEDGEPKYGNVKNIREEKSKENSEILISIDLSLSAYANASAYFDAKKATLEKQRKVEQNADKALKSIQQKIEKDLIKKQKESHDTLRAIRTPYFFEKYFWFISSEGFVVVMGKGAPETDQIFSKYIRDDDIFVSNNFEVKAWILNPEKTEIPPNTLMQAGIFVNSASDAWSKKIATSPWWCFARNLSKFDDIDGNILPPGEFRFKDPKEKNVLSPAQLVMGLGFLWKIEVECGDDKNNDTNFTNTDIDDVNLDQNQSDSEQKKSTDFSEIASAATDEVVQAGDLGFEVGNYDDVQLAADKIIELKVHSDTESSMDDRNDETKTIATKILENMNKSVRGKKGKLKKIQEKYGHQDEEERLLRLEALGTLKGIEREQKKKVEELEKEQKREYKKQFRKRQEKLRELKFTSSEKVEIDYSRIFGELKTVIGKDDVIADAIPVFAPWPALSKYKYKVKIQPGAGKKSKSINEALNHFLTRNVDASETDKEADWPREHEIIKHLKDQEIIPILCVDKLKITIPGSGDKKSSNNPKSSKASKKGSKQTPGKKKK